MIRCWKALISLTREQVRSLYAIAMLLGIVALSVESWILLGFAHHAAKEDGPMFGLIVRQLEFIAILTGIFALIVALVVFGADYLKAKYKDVELSAGKGSE